MAGMVCACFSFNRYADRDARSTAHEKSQAELVDLLRRNIDNPWKPPGDGGAGAGALSHDVIHGLDVTEALGLPALPADRIALVLGSMRARQLRYFGVDLEGQRLTATDADVSVGDGTARRADDRQGDPPDRHRAAYAGKTAVLGRGGHQ